MRKFILFLAFILYPLLVLAQPSSTFVLAVSDDTSTVYTTHIGFEGADVSKLGYKGIVTVPVATTTTGWTDGGTSIYLTTPSDNVGIGTSSPTSKLQVIGNITADTGTFTDLLIKSNTVDFADVTDGWILTFTAATNTWAGSSAGTGDITSVGNVTSGAAFDGTQGTTLTFNNAGGDGILLYNGEFSFDKNVGIGITNPTQALDVSGTINATTITGANVTSGADPGHTHGSGSITEADPLAILTTGTRSLSGNWYNGNFNIGTLGSVGIGNTNPAYKLDVTGDIRATGDIYSADQYTVTGDMGALGNLGVGTTTPTLKVDVRGAGTSIFGFVGGSMGIGNTAPQGLLDVSATTPGTGLVVLSTGRVGIGLTNPSVALDVSGTVNATALTEGGNAVFNTTETPGGELGGSWGTPTVDSTHSGSAHHSAVTVSGTPDYITLSGQDIIRAKLDISDDTNATGGVGVDITTNDFTFDATELTNLTWSAGGSALLTHTYNLSGTDPVMTFGNNYVSVSTGNLGVGNTAPQGLLDVGTSPGVGLIVLNTGNVGIGTTNPGFKLDVVGAMRTDDTIPIMRLVIKNIDNTFNKTGAVYSTQKNMVITRMDAICPTVASGTSAVFSLKTVGTDGTGPFTNLSVGQTAPLAKLTVTSFTGGTLPAGYGLIIDDIVQVGGTPPIYRLEVFGYEQ